MDGIFAFKSCKDRTVIRIQGKNIKESLSFHTVFKGNSQEAAARLIEKVGKDEFYKVSKTFGESIAKRYSEEIKKSGYKKMDDIKKKEKLDSVMEEEYNKMMTKYKIFDKKK